MPLKKLSNLLIKYFPKALCFFLEALETPETDQYKPKQISNDSKTLQQLFVFTKQEAEFYGKIRLGEKIAIKDLTFYKELFLSRAVKLEEMIDGMDIK